MGRRLRAGEARRQRGSVLAGRRRHPAVHGPERFDGWSDRRSDVYGIGVTLYELLTLRPAFEAADQPRLIQQILGAPPAPHSLDRRVPRDLETICLKAMAREPADRYASAAALAEDLRRFLADRTILARRSTAAEQAWRWCRRNPTVATLLSAVAALLVFIAAYSSMAAGRYREQSRRAPRRGRRPREAFRVVRRPGPGDPVQPPPRPAVRGPAALTEAAKIRTDPELRDEAIACLALRSPLVRTWPGADWPCCLDPSFTRFAMSRYDGTLRVKDIQDHREMQLIEPPGANGVGLPAIQPRGPSLAPAIPTGTVRTAVRVYLIGREEPW